MNGTYPPGGPGQTATLDVTSVASDGRGIARDRDGKVVFVSGALPGERVRAELVEGRARFSSAVATDVVEPSPLRISAPCLRLSDGCGGCQLQHVSAAGQVEIKEQILTGTLRRIGGIVDPPLLETVALPPWGYRTSIRAAVDAEGRPALRARHSHRVVALAGGDEGCLVAHPLLHPLLRARYPGAAEVTLRCGARTGDLLASVAPSTVAADLPAGASSARFTEIAAGRAWSVSARSFFQSRPDGADALADLVGEAAGGITARSGSAPHAIDLYSGVGLFAGYLAGRGWRVTAVEGSRHAAADAASNLEDLDVEVVHADVGRWKPPAALAGRGPDLVVADPSRGGLGSGGAATVEALGGSRVVLVSCDAASLARDLRLLGTAGYELSSLTAVDMFPQTFHVEAVAVLDRRGGA